MNERIRQAALPLLRTWYDVKWQLYTRKYPQIKIIVGSGKIPYAGWFETDVLVLDVTNANHFQRFFSKRKIERVLAEHVLEHLTTEQIELMARNIYKYSSSDVNIRIAVPDGFHTDSSYIEMVKPNGTGNGADDHKHLFTYQSLSEIFTRNKFKAHPIEYWDERGQFHTTYREDGNGHIRRSFINDARNADKKPHYTSLIVDFTKT